MAGLCVIGVTGASGAGKGAVCEILAGLGAYIIDTDKIAHEVILKGQPAYDEIINAFENDAESFLNDLGEIERRRLAGVVFGDEVKRKKLMEITHKYIVERSFDIVDKLQGAPLQYRFIVIDAPLLIEAGMHVRCDWVIGVVADEDVRVGRIVSRDGLTPEEARLRVRKQTPIDVLMRYADVVVENNGSVDELKSKVHKIDFI